MSSSPTRAQRASPQASERGLARSYLYHGPSMAPTFRPGHMLYVRPDAHDLAPGDVIVFVDPAGGRHVVHRVVAAAEAGWITRGDDNSQVDPLPVAYGQVVGRVEMAEAQGRLVPVRGGARGLWAARLRHGARRLGRWVCAPLRPLYRAMRSSPLLRRTLRRWLAPWLRTVRVETPGGPLIKHLYRGRVVAYWWPAEGRFACRKPFDLVISRPDQA